MGLRGEKEEWLRRGRVLSERVGLKEAEKMERDGLRKRKKTREQKTNNRRKRERKTWSRMRMSIKNRGRESDMSDSGEGNEWWDKRESVRKSGEKCGRVTERDEKVVPGRRVKTEGAGGDVAEKRGWYKVGKRYTCI